MTNEEKIKVQKLLDEYRETQRMCKIANEDPRTWKVVRLAIIEPTSSYLSRRLLMMVYRPAYPVTPYIVLFWDEDTGNYFNSNYFVQLDDAENRFDILTANHVVEEDVEYAKAVKSGRIQPIII